MAIGGSISVALVVGFCLPFGEERFMGTTYEQLGGVTTTFKVSKDTGSVLENRLETLKNVVRESVPLEADSLIEQVESVLTGQPISGRASKKSEVKKHATKKTPGPRQIAQSHSLAPQSPQAAPTASAPSFDAFGNERVGEWYESAPSRFSLDQAVSSDGILLRLLGLCRGGERFVLKLAVTNDGMRDFFIKEVLARDGAREIRSRFLFPLFVESGRTREGYLIFDGPQSGAEVKIILKEDRENGREIEILAKYPF